MDKKITPKQEQFAQNIFKGMHQRDAYRNAYRAEKMTDAMVDTQASFLVRKPVVAKRIQELRDTLAIRNIVTVEKVLDELSKIAFDDIKNYLDFENQSVCIGHSADGTPVVKDFTNIKIKDSEKIDTRNISEVQLDSKGNFKFKLYPKDNALTQLGRYLGMFTDRTEVTGKDGGPIEIENVREKFIEKLSKLQNKGTDQ